MIGAIIKIIRFLSVLILKIINIQTKNVESHTYADKVQM